MESNRAVLPQTPWEDILKQIDTSIEDMHAKFESAFAEAQDIKYGKIGPREEIKRGMFRTVWNALANVDAQQNFRTLAELDSYYHGVRRNLTNYRDEYIVNDYVRDLCEANNIMPADGEDCVISMRKMQMLEKIVLLYHALIRNRFIVSNLKSNQTGDLDHCDDMVAALTLHTSVNVELISRIKVKSYLDRIDALKFVNSRLTEELKKKGYGETDVDFLQPEGAQFPKGFFEVLGKLVDLPEISELVAIINGEKYDSDNMRARKLKEYVEKIRVFRYVLQQIRDDVVGASKKNLGIVNYDYEGIRQVNKIDQAETLNNFFMYLEMLLSANHSAGQFDHPSLMKAVFDVKEECGSQSQAEQYLPLINNGWAIAGSSINDNVNKLLILIRDELKSYLPQKLKYEQNAKGNVEQIIKKFQSVQRVLTEWRDVNEQTLNVLNECDMLLAIVEATVAAAMQSNMEFIASFLKRNWPTMAIVAGVCLVPAIAAPLVAASATTMAVTVPAAAVGGPALGAGFGMMKEKVKAQKTDALPPVVASQNGIKTKFIIDNLFKDPETVLAREVIVEDNHHAFGSVDVMSELDAKSANNGGIIGTLTNLPSQLTGAVTAVPNMVTSNLPDAVTSLPGKLVSLPGQLTNLPGFFSRQQAKEPVIEPVIDNPGELTPGYKPPSPVSK